MSKFENNGSPNLISAEIYTHMIDEDIEKMATTYSEGNIGLKNLLIYCAKNKISTFASCGGHPKNPEKDNPYIGFSLDASKNASILSKVFEKELPSDMRFLFHKADNELKLSIHVNNKNSIMAFSTLQYDMEHSKDMPENDLFNKLSTLIAQIPDNYAFLISGDDYRSIKNAPFLTVYVGKKIEYHYPINPNEKQPYTTIDTLLDNLIAKANSQQNLQQYLNLYNIKEFCKNIPHMGMNLVNSTIQKMQHFMNSKDNERNDEQWMQ